MFRSSGNVQDTLWTLIAAPTIWAAHFVLSYGIAAVDCAPNVDIFEAITTARWTIGGITALALLAIGLVLRRAVREWRRHGAGTVNDQDTPEARENFLEFSTVLLAALSFVSVVFVALPVLFNVDCR